MFRIARVGESNFPNGVDSKCSPRMERIIFSIGNKELFEVPEERVILTFLTKKNHLEEYVNADGHTEVS